MGVDATRPDQVVVFFDGVCGLCNRTIDILLWVDRRHRLVFAPLQGASAERLVPASDRLLPGSVLVLDRAGFTRESTAVVRVLWALGGIAHVIGWCIWLVPRRVRDALYRFVARNRTKVFGVRNECRVPTPAEAERFLR